MDEVEAVGTVADEDDDFGEWVARLVRQVGGLLALHCAAFKCDHVEHEQESGGSQREVERVAIFKAKIVVLLEDDHAEKDGDADDEGERQGELEFGAELFVLFVVPAFSEVGADEPFADVGQDEVAGCDAGVPFPV